MAYMEDEDEYGNALEETKTYAASTAPSPSKEKPNTSRTRKDKSRRDSSSPANALTDSDSTVHPSSAVKRESKMKSREKERDRDREREKSSSSKKQVTVVRPSIPKQSKTVPNLQSSSFRRSHDESSYYGVSPATTTTTAASSRPRAHTGNPRPNSYYGASISRPPLSSARYQHHYPPPPPPGALPTSFPPQAWQSAGPVSYPVHPSPAPPPQPLDYFASRPNNPLSARFNRPASAMGYRPSPTIAYGNGSDYDQENDNMPLIRRVSLTKKARDQEDRDLMPPPPRPSTTVTMRSSPFAPPPAPLRRTVGFDDDAFAGDGSLYQDVSPLTRYEFNQGTVARARRPSIGAPTVSYDVGSYRTEVAGRSSRRNSYYGEQSVSSGSGYEEKMRSATTYQHDVEGGPTMPLTAETLRKASKNSKTSSRSTRSSGSHDESDFRRSNTTRTTTSNDEDITIRVKGAATLKVGNAEMECKDGAEININSRNNGGTVRGGSDRDSSFYGDDRRTRIERPPTRARASSQAGSYTRTAPPLMYDPYYQGIPYRPAAPPSEWL